MKFRLIPRQEKFYADFISLADELMVGARLLEEMLSSEPPGWESAAAIQEVEHRCDTITHDVAGLHRRQDHRREAQRALDQRVNVQ